MVGLDVFVFWGLRVVRLDVFLDFFEVVWSGWMLEFEQIVMLRE